jgi:hypothetical protein
MRFKGREAFAQAACACKQIDSSDLRVDLFAW